ncbi:MAG: pyridoxine 5'-phosphate synthase [Gammaproteobacteria bacterium]|jgi:pyridoxine 5-phosphate synthase|nr:pyridoxine 5'-phosphate synthase [Gammaproteobacteria bacterium]MBT4462095.1 pyridoxine 5'-phosphate synthase [Gammaproteobacteria bacterium]MBT4654954.1 pyridoxine 5'-phosphate synthase [Gammaproteobacteria bacterium]MBT5116556.1 pyridoxine 5'-phosphate synthase [Gammaproteobacteria bacterium]MBT5761561.1 pyridoxine 5'-phosphate synthase [Gammaproteobacteria bacterium]
MKSKRIRLGVNLDHIAFIKKSRDTLYPSLADAVKVTEEAGADLITIHLREDRRHIQDLDAIEVRECAKTLNFEMAHTDEMIKFATELRPDFCCIVPEKREEKTTEGGLNLKSLNSSELDLFKNNIEKLKAADIKTSLFIDPDIESVKLSKKLGAEIIELHTGDYANKFNSIDEFDALESLIASSNYAHSIGLLVNAGHGLNCENIAQICEIPHIHELNIGHAIISQAVFTGLNDAIEKIISIMNNCD